MLGAIVGDIIGSIYEFENNKDYNFPLFSEDCVFTDDTVMTLCVAKGLYECKGSWNNLSDKTIKYIQRIGRCYPSCGYGNRFYNFVFGSATNYNSFGNGSAMRVSPVAWVSKSLDEVKDLSRRVTKISHGHPEGLKGAEATAVSIFLAKEGKSKEEIKEYVEKNYYPLNFTIDEIRPTYSFDETCQGSVPQAIKCFLESESFEDAIRLAISLGGDADTLGAITGSIAEAYYGIPDDIKSKALSYLDDRLTAVYFEVEPYIYQK